MRISRYALAILILVQIAWTWTLSLYIRLGAVSPVVYLPQMLKDIEKLGAWAFLLDLIVFIALYHVIKPHYRKWKGFPKDASEDEPLDNKTDN
jgi:hypothetical protein|tara:strand:+ start:1087 stop:1365 length:279 start_codon:yes stop_codon:yes gene_type:complete